MFYLLFWLGCKNDCGVPDVEGPDSDLVDVVQDSVDRFYADLASPLCVNSIKLTSVGGIKEGVYQRPGRKIRIEPLEDLRRMETNVWHELCHGVDFQLPVDSNRDSDLWPPL